MSTHIHNPQSTEQPERCPQCGRLTELELDPVTRLTRDLKEAAATLSDREVRFIVDYYYQVQEGRKAASNQLRALKVSGEPHRVIDWLFEQNKTVEAQIKRALDRWTDGKPAAAWSKSIFGIGPIIAAGLQANIDIEKAETVGDIWRFAGLDPTSKWEKGTRRPFNAGLKTLTWKASSSFVKFSNSPDDVYGKLWRKRMEYEWAKNISGALADQAKAKLANFKIDKKTDAFAWYSGCYSGKTAMNWRKTAEVPVEPVEDENEDITAKSAFLKAHRDAIGANPGMLSPAHIMARAQRWTVKLFLSHYHHVAFRYQFGIDPQKPFILEGHPPHSHFIPIPNWPF